ncbi:MAG: hypothetical protein ABF449_06640 [Ethanoligenens sp.]
MGERYYLPLDAILKYTGSSKTVNGSAVTVKRGSRSIRLDTVSGTLTEDNVENAIPTGMIQYEGESLFPAYAMLAYLGASCAFKSGRLMIAMPGYSLWDALDFPILNYALTPDKLWGNNPPAFMLCDSIMEFLKTMDTESPYHKIFAESLNDVMQVEPSDYPDGIAEEASYIGRLKQVVTLPDAGSAELSSFKTGFSTKDTFASLDLAGNFLGGSGQLLSAATKDSVASGNLDTSIAKSIASSADYMKISDTFSNASDAEAFLSAMTDIYTTINDRAKYSADSISALSSLLKAYPTYVSDYQESLCYQGADQLNKVLRSKTDAVADVIRQEGQLFLKKATEDGIDDLADMAGVSKYLGALKIGSAITAALPWNQAAFKSSDANLRAILLVQFLLETGDCINGVSKQITQSHYKDEKLIDTYRLMYILWTKATMEANTQLIKVAENGGNTSLIAPLKQHNQDLSVFLFKLVNANVSAIPSYQALYGSTDLDKGITGLTAAPTSALDIINNVTPTDNRVPDTVYDDGTSTYFISDEGEVGTLKRIDNQSGKTSTIINSQRVESFIIDGQTIIYSTLSAPNQGTPGKPYIGGDLRRANLDGTQDSPIENIQCRTNYFVGEDRIYYLMPIAQTEYDLRSCKLDGSDDKSQRAAHHADDSIDLIGEADGNLYFTNKNSLYSIPLSSPENTETFIASGVRYSTCKASDGKAPVYFFGNDEQKTLKIFALDAKSGLISQSLSTNLLDEHNAIAISDNKLYFTDTIDSTNSYIFVQDLPSGSQKALTDFHVTGRYIFYWGNVLYFIRNGSIYALDIKNASVTQPFSGASFVAIMAVTSNWIFCTQNNNGNPEGTQYDLIRINRQNGNQQKLGIIFDQGID